MEETNDVQALEKISSEVDESQIKVILSSQCIKAQAFLLDKLKKQSERHKETCGYISSANLKLEAEIKQAEQEINSMFIAQETIKSASVELKKEWLVTKVRKSDVAERIEEGKKKYEDLWLTCKARYESIPFVQKLLCVTEKVQVQNNNIDDLDKQIITLYETMQTQREYCIKLEQKRCIELAQFMVNEMPNTVMIIKERSKSIDDVTKQIKVIIEEQNTVCGDVETITTVELDGSELNENNDKGPDKDVLNNSDDDDLIPKLELPNFDLDIIDVNLKEAKMKTDEIPSTIPIPTEPADPDLANKKRNQYCEDGKTYEYAISQYFNSFKENKTHNFSKRKLINILEDVHINNDELYNIVTKVNPKNLQTVQEISAEANENVRETRTFLKDKNTPIQSDTIEEVDMTCSNADIIIPPTQFLDITLTSSQEGIQKKRVSFDIPSSVTINEIIDGDGDTQSPFDGNEAANVTVNSQLDVSVVSEDSFVKIQDMILKKHNLDLSPQFVYAKNSILQKKDDDKIVTSKFFQSDHHDAKADEPSNDIMETDEDPKIPEPKVKRHNDGEDLSVIHNNMPMDIDQVVVSSPKDAKTQEEAKPEKPVIGLLFTHGTQTIPDSLNTSMSTTGYDDSDFPHCIDSSLLLSPKADIPMTEDNTDVQSQEVPNFLSGFRKTGLSFFGGGNAVSSDPKPDSSAPNDENSFSFNFGGDKKNRGGLFSFFN